MTKRLFLFLLLAAPVAAVVGFSVAVPSKNPFPDERISEVIYRASIDSVPANAGPVRIWVPLASSRDGQIVLERDIKARDDYRITQDPVYGNEMAYFDLENPPPGPWEFEARYRVRVSAEDFGKAAQPEDDLDKYLVSSGLAAINQEVRHRTQTAIKGKKTGIDKARAIYENVIQRMTYDKSVPGWGRGDTARACLLGKGNCTDFHSLFISMAQAAKIPARFKIGLTIPEALEEGKIAGYHCWAEFLDERRTWHPVDASEAWKRPQMKDAYFGHFDTHKFLVSAGRNLELVPRQTGTPVNIFFYPYVEVNGETWDDVKMSFHYENLT